MAVWMGTEPALTKGFVLYQQSSLQSLHFQSLDFPMLISHTPGDNLPPEVLTTRLKEINWFYFAHKAVPHKDS